MIKTYLREALWGDKHVDKRFCTSKHLRSDLNAALAAHHRMGGALSLENQISKSIQLQI